MHKIKELKETIIEHLEEYADKGINSLNDLKEIDVLAHAGKNLGKIIEMCEEEESGSSFANAPGGYRGAYRGSYRRRRNRMGRYSREEEQGGGNSMDDGMSRESGYAEAQDDMLEKLDRKYRDARTDEERKVIRNLMTEMQR